MNEEQLNHLLGADWPATTLSVLKRARSIAYCYGWNLDSSLPKGKSVEDLVMDAVADLWAEPDRIRTDVPLATQLTNIVRSKLSNLADSPDEDVKRHDGLVQNAADHSQSKAEISEDQEELELLIARLAEHQKVKGKNDHELVLTAISCGVIEVEEIMEETGLSRARLYQVRRELRDIYPTIALQFKNEREGKAL